MVKMKLAIMNIRAREIAEDIFNVDPHQYNVLRHYFHLYNWLDGRSVNGSMSNIEILHKCVYI